MDELTELADVLSSLGASKAAAVCRAALEGLNDRARHIAVRDERLAQAMKREETLRQEIELLRKDNAEMAQQLEEMEAHPDVKAAKLAKLKRQHDALAAQIAKLE